jgi:hypothetical protein
MEVESQVFPLFSSFIRDLGKTYPEIRNCLYRNYETCLTGSDDLTLKDCPKLQAFLDLIYENQKLISKKDEAFFAIDVEILEEISFKNLWLKNISDKTRATVWKYLQTFSILTINLRSSQDLKDALSSMQNDEEVTVKDKALAKDIRNLKKLTESVQQDIPDEDGEMDLENMLGGLMDSNIGKIAQEVAGSMDMEKMFGNVDESTNPMELMGQMMNPEKMGAIFQNINSVMEQKMESGDISKDDLKKEAEGMYGTMAENPMFKGMMGQMQEGVPTATPNGPPKEVVKEEDKEPAKEPEMTKDDKRALLKEKIKAKEKERTGQ